jgi:PAS domain S-box-containing protein
MVWLMLTAALVGGWAWAQRAAEQGLQHRFELRITISADFVSNYVADQLARTNLQAERFLTGDSISERQLREVSTPFGYTAVVVLDEQGRLIQIVPARPALIGTDLTTRYDHLRTAVREGVPVVSRVVTSAARGVPVVAFATPYDTPRGRRVFSGALQVQNSPLGSYLAHAAALPSSRAYLIDPDGKVVASDGTMAATLGASNQPLAEALTRATSGTYRAGQRDWVFAAHPVAGTPWRIVAAVPASVLYLPARTPSVWRAIVAAVAALAGLLTVFAATRSRRHQQLLRESEQRFRDVFDNSLIGMAITTPTKEMVRVNPALCAMLGYSDTELRARTFTEITDPDDPEFATTGIEDAAVAAGANGFSAERQFLHADGRTVHASLTTSLQSDAAGGPMQFATQIIDVSERKAHEAAQERINTQLRESQQRVEDLVAMLSHDVRQPLGVITGYTETIIDGWDTLTDIQRRDFLSRISAAARRMTTLVEDVLALAQLDAGTVEPRRARINVVHALTEAITHLPEEHSAIINFVPPPQPAHAVADPGHLQQILLNLLGNAVKYGSAPIDVTVTTTTENVDVTVADHGEGVPEDFVAHLFERFTRAGTGAAVTKKGTGLGLYIVDQLAQANNAHISYQPNHPTGSCFTLRLSTAPPPADPLPSDIGASAV